MISEDKDLPLRVEGQRNSIFRGKSEFSQNMGMQGFSKFLCDKGPQVRQSSGIWNVSECDVYPSSPDITSSLFTCRCCFHLWLSGWSGDAPYILNVTELLSDWILESLHGRGPLH